MLHLIILLGLANTLLAHGLGNHVGAQAGTGTAVELRRRQLQEQNREALIRLRSLLSELLSQTPATVAPYPARPAGRRRKLKSSARPTYATQCLYETPTSYSTPLSATHPPGSGRCYLNPMVLAHPNLPGPESPIEIMLMKSAWTAYQCSFEKRKERCGTYRHPPYDCRWQEDQDRCAVTSDYLLPRLLAYLHCRDDATLTPFWDRCYTVGVLTNDSDWCGQSDGNWARCWWFTTGSETGICGPSPGGGVESREAYDKLVAQMRNGVWQQDWFGSCETAELVYTIKSACNYVNDTECEQDYRCRLRPDLPIEYGRCRLRDDLVWEEFFGSGSALFIATKAAMAECANASSSPDSCKVAGSLAPEPGGEVTLNPDKFSDVIDLVFIEEVTPTSTAGPRAVPSLPLLAAAVATATWMSSWVLLQALWGPRGPDA
ncbi:hypothetical protein Vretimale_8069 [Volvox reticuliferus]|uniref:Folate receptor-like domain-containing protein n=1 Tax=Volvox reticuliferus TaxID=1737510 RepID=A0A8J4FI71_9CHLO|nr:hypothetical protein Vretifemale_5224 [Volvox reticuliferus]GIM03307.1 hypothetical protein Vretimale_8069 [Volvox reticuliferus]